MELIRVRHLNEPSDLESAQDTDESTDSEDDDLEFSERTQLWKSTKITDKALCVKTMLLLFTLLFVATIFLTIFYLIGVGPWHLTHSRVTYGPSKYANVSCWNTSTITIFIPWENNTNIQNYTAQFAKDKGKKYVESRAHDLNDSTIDGLLNRTWEVYNYDFVEDGAICWIRLLHNKVRRIIRCNWIHPDRGRPEWHCNMACRPLELLPRQGYWDSEVVFPAPHKASGCRTWLPRWEFWGHYHLNCFQNSTPAAESSVNGSAGSNSTGADLLPRPTSESFANITAVLIRLGPRRFQYQMDQLECIRTKFNMLRSCLWSKFVKCNGQNYMVLALRDYVAFSVTRYREIQVGVETWLNNSFPWIWTSGPHAYFEGDFPEGAIRSPDGLKGPGYSMMHIQRLPTPDDLTNAPKDDFAKIDKCVAKRIFDSLNDTEWVKNGASPRCDIWQVSNTFYSSWKYNCPDPESYPTAKLFLQAWYENYHRREDYEWWGLQENELKAWVLPCLSQSENYWIKYQYLATVYSKERDIWPGVFWQPDLFVHPRPWRMTCNTEGTECTIGLARRPCQTVRGWEDHCKSHYGDEYDTHSPEVVWKKHREVWRRAIGRGVTCTDAILGFQLKKRKSILGVPVPFIPNTLVATAEGHAFRRSLCQGEMDPGFNWIGQNLLYSNLTCNVPKELWQKCGKGYHQHECQWFETLGSTVTTTIAEVAEEVADVVGGGLAIVEHWLLSTLGVLWPYLLGALGLIIALMVGKVVLEVWLKSLCRCKGKSYELLPQKEELHAA